MKLFLSVSLLTTSLAVTSVLGSITPTNVGKHARKLYNNNNNNQGGQNNRNGQNGQEDYNYGNGGGELSGNYDIKFHSCVSMEMEDGGGGGGHNGQYGGTSVQEFLILDVIDPVYGTVVEQVSMDVGTYINSVGGMVYESVENYCEVCEDMYEQCVSLQQQQGQGQEGGGKEKGGWFNWWDNAAETRNQDAAGNGNGVEYATCEKCSMYNCANYNGYNNNGEQQDGEQQEDRQQGQDGKNQRRYSRRLSYNANYGGQGGGSYNGYAQGGYRNAGYGNANDIEMDEVFEYLTEISECQRFWSSYSNNAYTYSNNDQDNVDLYIGFMCNEYGTGIKLGFFLDDECSVYTNDIAVDDYISTSSQAGQYLSASRTLLESLFVNEFSCKSVEYANPYYGDNNNNNGNNQNNNNNNQNNNNNNDGDMNEYCAEFLEADNTFEFSCKDDGSDLCTAISTIDATYGYYDRNQDKYGYSNAANAGNPYNDGNNYVPYDGRSGYIYENYGHYAQDARLQKAKRHHFWSSVGSFLLGWTLAAIVTAFVLIQRNKLRRQRRKSNGSSASDDSLLDKKLDEAGNVAGILCGDGIDFDVVVKGKGKSDFRVV